MCKKIFVTMLLCLVYFLSHLSSHAMFFNMLENPVLNEPTRYRPLLDYAKLSREIFVQLRGTMSQSDLSQKLGYKFNQVGKWESGATHITWIDFIRLCKALNIPWEKNFRDVFVFHTDMFPDPTNVFTSLSQFFGFSGLSEIAEFLNKSRSSVSRLLHNQVKTDFADVLLIMDTRHFVLNSWLSKFLKPSELECFKEKYEEEVSIAQGLLAIPWATFVNASLQLAPYKNLPEHSDGWIAEKTGLQLEQVQQALQSLLASGLIFKIGTKYHSLIKELTFMRIPGFRKLTRFVLDKTAETYQTDVSRTPNPDNPSLTSVWVYPVSSVAAKKIADAMVHFHHQVNEIVKNDTAPKDHVRNILIHSVDMSLMTHVSKNAKT